MLSRLRQKKLRMCSNKAGHQEGFILSDGAAVLAKIIRKRPSPPIENSCTLPPFPYHAPSKKPKIFRNAVLDGAVEL